MNLLGNAVKFTEKGHVSLHVRLEKFEPENFVQLRFEIDDSGIGISPERLSKLFSPFEQGDSSTNRKFGGTGLGLVISKALIKAMEGDISILSVQGQGTQITFEIKLLLSDKCSHHHSLDLDGLSMCVVSKSQRAFWSLSETLKCLDQEIKIPTRHIPTVDSAITYMNSLQEQNKKAPDFLIIERSQSDESDKQVEKLRTICLGMGCKIVFLLGYLQLCDVSNLENKNILYIADPPSYDNVFQILTQHNKKRKQQPVAEESRKRSRSSSQTGLIILSVEDNPINQMVLERNLAKLGHACLKAEDGKKGLELYKEKFLDIDFVFMDLQMPNMDGYDSAKAIREFEKENFTPSAPIAAVTAGGTSPQERCFEVGMNYFFTKPYDFLLIEACLNRVLKDKRV